MFLEATFKWMWFINHSVLQLIKACMSSAVYILPLEASIWCPKEWFLLFKHPVLWTVQLDVFLRSSTSFHPSSIPWTWQGHCTWRRSLLTLCQLPPSVIAVTGRNSLVQLSMGCRSKYLNLCSYIAIIIIGFLPSVSFSYVENAESGVCMHSRYMLTQQNTYVHGGHLW